MNQRGFANILVMAVIGLVVLMGGYFVVFKKIEPTNQQLFSDQQTQEEDRKINQQTLPEEMSQSKQAPLQLESGPPQAPQSYENQTETKTQMGYWQDWGYEYRPIGNVPPCPDPLIIPSPTDLKKVTAILYPGQYRGGTDYKPHGGFRLDNNKTNEVTVQIPLDAELIYGSRHFLDDGELQWLLGFRMPCGIEYRLDHLRTLAPKFQKLLEARLPPPKWEDSRTTKLNPPIPVIAGEIIATEVGFATPLNVGFDFGVYDLRKKNKKAADPIWIKEHENNNLAQYAVCWFDWLSSEDEKLVRSLPAADWKSGAQSDFCE